MTGAPTRQAPRHVRATLTAPVLLPASVLALAAFLFAIWVVARLAAILFGVRP